MTVLDDQEKDDLKGNKKSQDLFFADINRANGDDDKLKVDKNDIIVDLGEQL
ncbi:MAG: hypothetical protein P8J37_04455 [Fuerstiella sp.]|nr:hypothetical protein [Fuerstiella sp.]